MSEKLPRFSVRGGQVYETKSNEPWSGKQLSSYIRRAGDRVRTNKAAGIDSSMSREIQATLASAKKAKGKVYGRY